MATLVARHPTQAVHALLELARVESCSFPIGPWACMLLPRCGDSTPAVRAVAALGCDALLTKVNGEQWRRQLLSDSPAERHAGCSRIAAAFAKAVPADQLLELLRQLLQNVQASLPATSSCE